MAKQLRTKDRLLFGLAALGDVLEWVVIGGNRAYWRGEIALLMPEKYKKDTFRRLLYRLYKTGWIEKTVKDNQVYLQLTNRGKKQIIRDFPLLAWQKQKWDKIWRVVVFDIEEKQKRTREFLRAKLYELGFGQLQKSIYISPFDVADDMAEFLEHQRLLGRVFVWEVRHRLMGDADELARRVWSLDKINRQYEEILYRLDRIKKGERKLTERKIKHLLDQYFEILLSDPCLPKELLPADWWGLEVQELLGKLLVQLGGSNKK